MVRKITATVERAEIYTSSDGRSRGFGYVRIKGLEEAIMVKGKLQNLPRVRQVFSELLKLN